jgi:ABC-type microcin C transport system duplicated ATPase subunit YejF
VTRPTGESPGPLPQQEGGRPAVLEVEDVSIVHPRPGLGWARAAPPPAVAGVSLTVREGEVVGLVGESGSGKSSLAMAIVGIGPGRLAAGRIRVHGQELRGLRGRALREARADVQIVFQDPTSALDPRQRIGAGLTELRRVHATRTGWIDDRALLASVGLDVALLPRYPHQLSGGQVQRIAVARALLLRPRLLIADEPTSSLDVSVQAQILTLLQGLRDERGIAMLFISHDLRVVRHLCDRVLVMLRGSVVEQGEPERLFERPKHEYTVRLIDALPGRGH